MTDLSKNILAQIKVDNVRPYSKWRFIFKRSVIWTLFLLSVLSGSFASAVTMFQLRYAEWDLYHHFSHSLTEFIFLVIPFFWLVFILGFTGFAYYYFRHTQQGYRYRTFWVVAGSIILSFTGGGLLCATTFPERLESLFQKNVSFYRNLHEHKMNVWMSPGNGLLAGEIGEIISAQEMRLKDLKGRLWTVMIGNTIWRGQLKPVKNIKIKLIGRMQGEGRFRADEIRPWDGRGRRGGKDNCKFSGQENENKKELLVGEIHKIISDRELRLKDSQGRIWTIDITDTLWRGRLKPVKNLKIRVFGNKESASRFVAAEIKPQHGHGRRRRQADSEYSNKPDCLTD
ncbi:hypothetical protein QUF90_15710 [Desulfococcaceae bacterium HSG9]|nr:hypothetical protein [Desulfococcaceae bacterium HSG9]